MREPKIENEKNRQLNGKVRSKLHALYTPDIRDCSTTDWSTRHKQTELHVYDILDILEPHSRGIRSLLDGQHLRAGPLRQSLVGQHCRHPATRL
jgi:hypothetical protein